VAIPARRRNASTKILIAATVREVAWAAAAGTIPVTNGRKELEAVVEAAEAVNRGTIPTVNAADPGDPGDPVGRADQGDTGAVTAPE